MNQAITPRQQRFVNEYLVSFNARQAAIKAGYSVKSAKEQGHRLLTYDHIKQKIERTMNEAAEKLGITIEYVLTNIKNIAENENEKALPTKLKANELLGKHLKIFHDTEINVTMQHRDVIKQLEELE